MTIKRKISLIFFIGFCFGMGMYHVWSAIIYYRSTFFIYPNIKENYEIIGRIDTPEEAIEACRTNFSSTDIYGERTNFVRQGIWDEKLKALSQSS